MLTHLIKAAARIWRVSPALILGPQRTLKASRPRFAVAYVAMRRCGISSQQLAQALDRDRSTIETAARRAETLRDAFVAYRERLDELAEVAAGLIACTTAMDGVVAGSVPASSVLDMVATSAAGAGISQQAGN